MHHKFFSLILQYLQLAFSSKILFFSTSFFVTGILFNKYGSIDIWLSQLFFNDIKKGFSLRYITSIIDWTAMAIAAMSAIFLIHQCIQIVRIFFFVTRKAHSHGWRSKIDLICKQTTLKKHEFLKFVATIAYLVTSFFGSYVFITVVVIKRIFHRARPFQIEEFGGIYTFTPAFSIGHQCMKDCSFVSGHAAAGFVLFALVFAIPSTKRTVSMWVAVIAFGMLFGISRVAGGYHFLSDVIFAGIWIFSASWLLYTLCNHWVKHSFGITIQYQPSTNKKLQHAITRNTHKLIHN